MHNRNVPMSNTGLKFSLGKSEKVFVKLKMFLPKISHKESLLEMIVKEKGALFKKNHNLVCR